MTKPHDWCARRGLTLLLLLAALLVRGAIPQGYMAESTSPGTLTVTVCHSEAVVQIPLGGKKGPAEPADPEPQPCVSSAYKSAMPPVEFASELRSATGDVTFSRFDAPFSLTDAARRLPHARGPPATA